MISVNMNKTKTNVFIAIVFIYSRLNLLICIVYMLIRSENN